MLAGDSREIDEEVAKEWEHTLLQNTMDKELHELNKRLEQKEVCICCYSYMYSIKLTSGSSIWIHIFWISVKEREKRDCSICYYFLLEYFMQGKSLNLEFFYWYS